MGRFARFGYDVYVELADELGSRPGEQDERPYAAVIDHDGMTREHWSQFQAAMLRHHAVVVPDAYMPDWLAA